MASPRSSLGQVPNDLPIRRGTVEAVYETFAVVRVVEEICGGIERRYLPDRGVNIERDVRAGDSVVSIFDCDAGRWRWHLEARGCA